MLSLLLLQIPACAMLQAMLFQTNSTAQLTDVVSEPIFDIAGVMKAARQQGLDPALAGGSLN